MKKTFLIFVLFFAIIFRVYNINWGSPFYFHPDERNIANAISQLRFPNQMNPHFFAYGSFPVYITYFIGIILNKITGINPVNSVSLESSILILRFISFILSVFLFLIIYKVGKEIGKEEIGILSFLFASLSTGFIQFSHFGTFETILSFLSLLLFFICLKLIDKIKIFFILISGLIFGLLLGTKVSSITLFPVIFFSLFYGLKKSNIFYVKNILIYLIFFLCSAAITLFITNPFTFFDFTSFIQAIKYESMVAQGSLHVFYTGEFIKSIPVLFQIKYVYPFLLNPVLEALFLIAFIFVLSQSIRDKNPKTNLLLLFFLLQFIPQAFLFAKWTRYMVPTLPFIYIIIAYFLHHFLSKQLRIKLTIFLVLVSFLYSLAFVKTAYINKDTRIEASEWMKNHVKNNVQILSESYDLGILPFNQSFSNIELFNFYELDASNTSDGGRLSLRSHDSSEVNKLGRKLQKADYLILPSQRVFRNKIMNPTDFPIGNKFYSDLISNKLNYKKEYETPCDVLCKIAYLGNPVFNIEETATVFDRPTVYIFKKE